MIAVENLSSYIPVFGKQLIVYKKTGSKKVDRFCVISKFKVFYLFLGKKENLLDSKRCFLGKNKMVIRQNGIIHPFFFRATSLLLNQLFVLTQHKTGFATVFS